VNQAVKDPGATLLSWGFGPFSALVRKSDLHRACLTRLCCTHRLSQPLSALFLSWPSRPCFMPVALLGFWTLQSFPLLKIGSPFGSPSRLDVTASLTPQPKSQWFSYYRKAIQDRFLVPGQPVSNQQFAFTGLIPSAVRSYAARYYPYNAADALLGLAPSKVFSLFALEDVFTSSSSYVRKVEPLRRKFLPCTIEFQRTKRLAYLASEAADLLGVCALVGFPGPLVFAQSWLMDLPQSAGCVTVP
jgi:hypothetical protein